jgi:hypothetical protein
MFLKSRDYLLIANPSEDELLELFLKINNELYCLSSDSRVGSVYSGYAENSLEINRKTVALYQISIKESNAETGDLIKTVITTVDLITAVKIAYAFSLHDESWRMIGMWQEKEESLLDKFKGFIEILTKPIRLTIPFLMIIILSENVLLKNNFSILTFFNSQFSSSNTGDRKYIIGDIVQNKSLVYRVNEVQFSNRGGGRYFIGQDAGQGNMFVIIDFDIKNTGTESLVIDGGEVRVSYNGKWLRFETPEPVFNANHITFNILNPLKSFRGKVAFKVPEQLEGPFYWSPHRTNSQIKLTTK